MSKITFLSFLIALIISSAAIAGREALIEETENGQVTGKTSSAVGPSQEEFGPKEGFSLSLTASPETTDQEGCLSASRSASEEESQEESPPAAFIVASQEAADQEEHFPASTVAAPEEESQKESSSNDSYPCLHCNQQEAEEFREYIALQPTSKFSYRRFLNGKETFIYQYIMASKENWDEWFESWGIIDVLEERAPEFQLVKNSDELEESEDDNPLLSQDPTAE